MEGVGNPSMAMPLSIVEVAYNIVQKTSTNPDLTPPQEIDPVLDPIWAQNSLTTHDPLYFVFPSDEAILEEMTGPNRPWDDLHHRYYFLFKLRRVEAGEFTTTMNGDATCLVNPLAMHIIYVEGNMASIAEIILINISKNHNVVENVFIEEDCS
jgi:hypothetical protein